MTVTRVRGADGPGAGCGPAFRRKAGADGALDDSDVDLHHRLRGRAEEAVGNLIDGPDRNISCGGAGTPV